VHSLLIYKGGKLVLEEYFTGHKYQWDAPNHYGELVNWRSSMPHVLQSVTKSITSACIGIAIDNGFIGSVRQSIFDYLPDHQDLKTDGRDKITIEHLLTMTSGLKWDEWSASLSSIDNDMIGIWFNGQEDPIRYVLERPLVNEPGTSFKYNGGNMFILGEIIKNASGMYIDEFSGKYLFEPLGTNTFNWYIRYENGEIDTASSLAIKPRDMLKIGVTFLNYGIWNGKQIISEEWIKKSSTPYKNNTDIKIPGEDLGKVGYSYNWWIKEFSNSGREINMYWANGWGGQKIVIFPEIDMVIVFTGGNYNSTVKNLKILEKYILPAIK
jgi:CubicO group peptidase (beta-lactamase class C family)